MSSIFQKSNENIFLISALASKKWLNQKIKGTSLKFMFSKKATKFEKIFTVDLTLCCKCQIDSEDFVSFCGLLRKHEIYLKYSLISIKKWLCLFCLNNVLEARAETRKIFSSLFGLIHRVYINIVPH